MNKNELIAHMADHSGITKAEATKAMDAMLEGIGDALQKGDEVRIAGFGIFTVAERPASEGRNPRTGEKIQIPASRQPKFKAGKGLKDSLNG